MTIVFLLIALLFIISGVFLRNSALGWLLILIGSICLFLVFVNLLFDLILGILIGIGIVLFITIITVSIIYANAATVRK
jgi:hypothetical protein